MNSDLVNIHINTPAKTYDCRQMYQRINSSPAILGDLYAKWNYAIVELDITFDEYVQSFQCVKLITNIGTLHSFQYRFLHRAIILNDRAYHWRLTKSNLCSFCNEAKEKLHHIFCECTVVRKFWNEVANLSYKMFKIKPIINATRICLNTFHSDPRNVINFMGLVAKQYIYAMRYKNKVLDIGIFQNRILKFRNYELYNAKINGKVKQHIRKWYHRETGINQSGLDSEYVDKYTEETT